MRNAFDRRHSGTTLIELLIFIAVLSMIVATALPLLFSATESRILQQTISIVEQNGTQILQNATLRVHNAERIISPAIGQTGSVLVLQTGSGNTNPTIIGFNSGSIVIVERSTQEVISSSQVAVQDFVVRNTSTSATRQSVTIGFRVSRTIRLQQPHSYAQRFETGIRLHPNDVPLGASCVCNAPTCLGNNQFRWSICTAGNCLDASTAMQCP